MSKSLCDYCKKETNDILCVMQHSKAIICDECNNIKKGKSIELMKQKIQDDISESQSQLNQTIADNKAKGIACCPKCGSTSIEAVQRGYSFWTGFLGSGKTMNYCKNCGFKYDPKNYR
jgi:hypothetical protein